MSEPTLICIQMSAFLTGRKAAIAADLAVGPLPFSQLDDTVVLAPGMQDLPPMPNYGLGMKICDNPPEAVLAAADHLRNQISKKTGLD